VTRCGNPPRYLERKKAGARLGWRPPVLPDTALDLENLELHSRKRPRAADGGVLGHLGRLIHLDAALSVMLHAIKALVALFVNWLVLREFSIGNFVVWSVTSSILVVAAASDLGIGQYAVTRMINSARSEWGTHMSASLGALMPLALVAALIVFALIDGPTAYRAIMALLIALRTLTIPYSAVLNAANQFKIRKAVELSSYVLLALLVGALTFLHATVHLALLSLNASFFLGALLTAVLSTRYVPFHASLSSWSASRSMRVFRSAVPFTVNNLTGLLTYGGFMWLSSLVLPKQDVAKLAVLHAFVLMNAYQLYDVFLRSRQADLADPLRLPPYRALNLLIMLTMPVAFFLVGRQAVQLIDIRVHITSLEAVLFGLLLAFELGNLFAQSITQVRLALVARLNAYSALRAVMLVGFALAGFLPIAERARLPLLLGILALGSAVAFGYLIRNCRADWRDNNARGIHAG